MTVTLCLGPCKHFALDLLQKICHNGLNASQRKSRLVVLAPNITAAGHSLLLLQILRSQLQPQRHSLQLPVSKSPPRRVVVAQVCLDPDTSSLQPSCKLFALIIQRFLLLLRGLGGQSTWDDDNLERRNHGWHDQPSIITVHHDHDPKGPCCQAPGILVSVLVSALLVILKLDAKHLGEVLAQVVGCGTLHPTPSHRDKCLHSRGKIATCKLFLLGFLSFDNWYSQVLLIDTAVKLKDVKHLLLSLRLVDKG
mmetsp:Transcript_140772/g.245221  ORF Transcript_140772/g.245221 Transcript_140772/m.245221 type:complete len:252 (-) Transcript_140772:1194-1949(-)